MVSLELSVDQAGFKPMNLGPQLACYALHNLTLRINVNLEYLEWREDWG